VRRITLIVVLGRVRGIAGVIDEGGLREIATFLLYSVEPDKRIQDMVLRILGRWVEMEDKMCRLPYRN